MGLAQHHKTGRGRGLSHMRNESDLLLVLVAPLVVKMMLVTNEGQELRQVNLSLATKNLITDENTTVHPGKA